MHWGKFSVATFDQHAAEWDELAALMPGAPFLRSTFLRKILGEFGTGEELLMLGTDRGALNVAILVFPLGGGLWQTFQPSQLPLGALVAAPELDFQEALAGICTALPGFCLVLGVTQQDPRYFTRQGDAKSLRTLDYVQTAWVDVKGSFDDYWAARGKNLRQNMRKQRNKLAEDGVTARLEVLRGPDEMAAAVHDYGALESAGWKSASGTAIHPGSAQGRFYLAVLEAFCSEGRGRVHQYLFDDRVVAMDLCIEGDDTLVILKTTYDESFKSLSPAFLMRQDAFQQIFGEGIIRRIEFYGKRMEWHTRWTENVRTLYHVNYFRWSWLSHVRSILTRLRSRTPTPDSPAT